MIKPSNLKTVLLKVENTIILLGMRAKKKPLGTCIIDAMGEDVHFFNLFTSVVLTSFSSQKTTKEAIAISMMDILLNNPAETDVRLKSCKSLIDLGLNFIKGIETDGLGCFDIRAYKQLNSILTTDELPKGWSKRVGVCNNLRNVERFTSLTAITYVLSNPFHCCYFPLQDPDSHNLTARHDYGDSTIEKYEGKQLELRLEFISIIIGIIEHFDKNKVL